jgi:hypothetical protein
MSTPKTITGTFVLPNGAPAAGAVITFLLSQNAQQPGGQLLHVPIQFTLDENGSIPADSEIFANDQLQPSGTYYVVSISDPVFMQYFFERYVIAGASPINLNSLSPM